MRGRPVSQRGGREAEERAAVRQCLPTALAVPGIVTRLWQLLTLFWFWQDSVSERRAQQQQRCAECWERGKGFKQLDKSLL